METPRGAAAEPRHLALAAELVRRSEEDQRLTRLARETPTALNRHFVTRCRGANADALRSVVARRGWPQAAQVGEPASTAALMILLHTADLGFQLTCRDLIAEAVADGGCPAVHHAYIADHCAVELGQPQFYGTRIDADTLCPYPIRHPETVEERREDVGLDPLAEQLPALRHVVGGIPDSGCPVSATPWT
ncbi:DUF6624 domain-containing protein [Streptomyces sp. WI04-05B]|uniref:DUF6624 domain-containing protein n=1 Tax=Streptomyces TaxID=1883 RepID=UPI0029AB1B09|nr:MULTISPECIES: DUF6624 domain-containing protein [unclassified Streptomyces]MDX2546016.1 hypothetical protein [Streptomyces sp. WI04-05B]MDX2582683.1 hypothetical protein [Streptomyces sp. WI04-05A]MDX3747002.1 hypothetical protein [Streptomyces sp. AK08-02]